jgi:ABC-2 type transport system permease protein
MVVRVLENITVLSILLVGAAVIREREHGTIEHLLVMPVRASEIAVAKIWANGLVILVAAGLSLHFVVQGALGVPIEGSTTLFLTGAAAYLFATTSLGMQTVIQVSPTVHFVKLAQAVLFRAAGLEIVWPQLLILAGLGSLFLAAALARFRTMLARAHQ